jgi:hypothetical protein
MDILLLLFLILFSILLTVTITVFLRNRGPWENPILFFLVLFMTTWTIYLWMGPDTSAKTYHHYISAASLMVLISLLLAAVRINIRGKEKLRKIKDREVVDVVTEPAGKPPRIAPNTYFWILITVETLLILSAYYAKIKYLPVTF